MPIENAPEREIALEKEYAPEDAEPGTPPIQFTPPVLDFDVLYRYPTEAYDRSVLEFEASLKERQNYFSERAGREKAQMREAEALTRLAETERLQKEAEHAQVVARTHQAAELHSQHMQEQAQQLERTLQANQELQKEVSAAQQSEKEAVVAVERAQARIQHIQTHLYRSAAILCCCLAGFSGGGFYRLGYVRGYKADLEAQVASLQTEKQDLTDKIAALEATVARLNPPPPALSAEEAERQLSKAYHELDADQNKEDTSRLFAWYDPKYVVETDRFTNNLIAFKASLRQELFQNRVIHQQMTRLENAPTSSGSSGLPAHAENASSAHAENVASANNVPPQNNAAGDTASKADPPLTEVVDNDTVRVSIVRELFKWTRMRIWTPARPAPKPEPTGEQTSPPATAANDTSVAQAPPVPNVPLFTDHNSKQEYRQRDTWHRASGRWRLARSVVLSVSETPTERYLPVLKCRNIQCGQYYVNGLDKPLSEEGEATKTCPHCGRRLYIAEPAP